MQNNKIKLSVCGVSFSVSTSEDEAYVKKLAESLERDIKSLLTDNSGVTVTNAAVLCAIDYLDKYQKANRSATNMRSQIKDYLSEAANAKMMYDEEHGRVVAAEAELLSLKGQLTRMAESGSADEVLQVKLDDAEARLKALQDEKSALEKETSGLNERVTALNEYITRRDGELDELKGIVDIQVDKIIKLEEALEKKQGEITGLSESLSSLEEMITGEPEKPEPEPDKPPEAAKEKTPQVQPEPAAVSPASDKPPAAREIPRPASPPSFAPVPANPVPHEVKTYSFEDYMGALDDDAVIKPVLDPAHAPAPTQRPNVQYNRQPPVQHPQPAPPPAQTPMQAVQNAQIPPQLAAQRAAPQYNQAPPPPARPAQPVMAAGRPNVPQRPPAQPPAARGDILEDLEDEPSGVVSDSDKGFQDDDLFSDIVNKYDSSGKRISPPPRVTEATGELPNLSWTEKI